MKTNNQKETGIQTLVMVFVTGLLLSACGRDNIEPRKLLALQKLMSHKVQGISPHKRATLFAFLAPRLGFIKKGVAACKSDYLKYKKQTIVMPEIEDVDASSVLGRRVTLSIDQLIAQKGAVVSFFVANKDKVSEPCQGFLTTVEQIRAHIQAKR